MRLTRSLLLELVALVVVLIVAAYLRFHNLTDNPYWYTDEATHVNIAQNILDGHTQYLAVGGSTLLFARLPLFEYILAGMMRVFGDGVDSMATLRALTASLGLITTATLYIVARRITQNGWLAILAALLLALYPQAILYNRFGFSYNLLAPLVLLFLMGLVEYARDSRPAWLILAALAIGLGLISDLMAGTFLPVLIAVVLMRRTRHLLWAIPLVALPFGIYTLASLLSAPSAFIFDLKFTLTRLNTLTPDEQFETLIDNYNILLTHDLWFPVGLLGLFALRPLRVRLITLSTLSVPLVILGRTVALHNLSAYYMIPLLPLIPLGIATIIWQGCAAFWHSDADSAHNNLWRIASRFGAIALLFALISVPIAQSLTPILDGLDDRIVTEIDGFLLNPADVRNVGAYINARISSEDDVVVSSAGVGWIFAANAADFQMSVAINGAKTVHLPEDLPSSRFVFDPNYRKARFVVIDDLWRFWGVVHIPAVADMRNDVETNWTLVYQAGTLAVYQNPAFPW
jgi:4-amino-4-deoxy-L-arabinose transferase-like glycosyltransferase